MSRKLADPQVPAPRTSLDPVSTWVAEGIISADQAARIRAREDAPHEGARRSLTPVVLEALGYLGGAIVVTATSLIAGQYWDDLGDGGRLVLLGAATLLLLAAGAAVPRRLRDVGARLTAALWLVSTATAAGFLGVWGDRVADLHGADLALLVTGCAAAYAAVLFLLRRGLLQQLAMMGLAAGAAAALLAQLVDSDSWPGVGPWVVGVLWLLLGEGGMLQPVRLTRLGAAVLVLIGSLVATSDSADASIAFALFTVILVILLAVLTSDLAILAVGALGTIQAVLIAVNAWFPSSLSAALALLVVGAGLVGLAVGIARRPPG